MSVEMLISQRPEVGKRVRLRTRTLTNFGERSLNLIVNPSQSIDIPVNTYEEHFFVYTSMNLFIIPEVVTDFLQQP